MTKKLLAIAALALAVVFAAPTGAMAAGYVPPGNGSSSGGPTTAAGGSVTVTFVGGSFSNGEQVAVSVTGDPKPTLGAIGTATSNYAASGTGGLVFKVTVPASATGSSVYSAQAVGATSGNVATYRITVAASGSAVTDPRGLAFTGGTVPMLIVWSGAGILALGIALMIVLRVVRRQRAQA
jgi:hypothetical protein